MSSSRAYLASTSPHPRAVVRRTSSGANVFAENSSQESAPPPPAQSRDYFDEDEDDDEDQPNAGTSYHIEKSQSRNSQSYDFDSSDNEDSQSIVQTQEVDVPEEHNPWARAASPVHQSPPLIGDYYELDATQPPKDSSQPSVRPDSGYDSRDEDELQRPPRLIPHPLCGHSPIRQHSSMDLDSKLARQLTTMGRLGSPSAEDLSQEPLPRATKKRKISSKIAKDTGDPESESEPEANVAPSRKRKRPAEKQTANAIAGPSRTRRSARKDPQASSSLTTRVYAYWEQDKHYYPGTVTETVLILDNGGLYTVVFDDGNESSVELKHLRFCSLRPGDIVSGAGLKATTPGTIVSCTGSAYDSIVHIRIGTSVETFLLKDVSIPKANVDAQWDNRVMVRADISAATAPAARPQRAASTVSKKIRSRETRSTRKTSTKKSARSSPENLFRGIAFLITGASDSDLTEVCGIIEDLGGDYVAEWADLMPIVEPPLESTSTVWVSKQSDIGYNTKGYPNQRIVMLSDDVATRPKFLIALALGVPCLSFAFVRDCGNVTNGQLPDMQSYLLPRGIYQDLMLSQMVDLGWLKNGTLDRIQDNILHPKLMDGKRILVVGAKVILLANVHRDNIESPIPAILFAMGAAMVEAINHSRFAKEPLENYDLIIVKEPSDKNGDLSRTRTHVAQWSDVKDSLILGREIW
ncbi:hypothetical protein DL96DRAFT_1810085 [Flagelloscypha sp. PMI_526]|nr:hypothetical protein DL96DRAFT_1810085 [Flagelloscypha sp. PMI_526]